MSSSCPGPEVISLGCRLNLAESETIRALLGSKDVVVVNSCAVTNEAVRQTRQAIRRARRARPGAQLVVTGCAAQIDPQAFGAMPEVDRVIGNAEKLRAEAWEAYDAKVQVQDIMAVRQTAPHLAASFSAHARAFVEVQNGCDHRCTFCAIPYGRGNSRSVPAGAVVERVRALVEAGHREIVLTGVDLTSYGPDLPGAPSLGMLVERVLARTAVERLRLSSLDGIEIDARLFALLTQEARVMPHVHLSLQAGDDMVLKRMKRRHLRAQSVALVERLKAARTDIAIGADLIAGFPTEDETMFANTLALIDDCDIVHAHIFPYSPRDGTPAARMPQVAPGIAKARAAALRERAAARRARWLDSLVGTRQAILVERPGDRGHAGNFAEVRLSDTAEIGTIREVTIIDVQNGNLFATPRHPGLDPGSRSLAAGEVAGPRVKPGVTKNGLVSEEAA
ncbi:tRNA (N(6)-L-threonylcarbamoyladenosine(37)-C(2))-methylthiotransferase MtaB [Sphingomonas sp. BT-65]|uniref:tRNA (N(6)-L-threonylcarbamoyladenosine(37)-C(2))- methylthiotransferase MtaB n=1 Tax=Sphingomonas sp. BT-65 TaxID=2989821 RepID=UPI002235B367|nr:tRNA (N(6)-L-threonylcarbamoyladenosine(37)-C(2))-methylthiotransferase MtaB [Sphingomonas sp. BT-65]MCW4460275.1 tRNA (N(6)-L-threonylcarbamoyladenosine(37)-C(2))-methylthiotransferase MtaB [Sphingomonas sp. BT-65]